MMENYIDFKHLLTDEELMVQENIRTFVDQEFMPLVTEHHRAGTFPLQLVPRMAELGVFGASIKEYDLPDLSAVPYGLIMLELERGDSGLRSFASVQNSLVMFPIMHFGSEAQKDRWIPALASGKVIGCYGLTEPDFGSNPGGMRTRLKTKGKGFVLDGAKAWITNGSLADVGVVWARDDSGAIRGVLVEKGMPGFEARAYQGKFSLRASNTSELFFQDVAIAPENILPGTSALKHPLMCLNEARFGIAWGAVGAALAVSEHALEYTKSRVQFGDKPIAAHQIVQEKLAWMVTELAKAQVLMWHLSKLKDAGKLHHSQVSLAKRNNVWMARECARLARELLGAAGIVDDHPVIRHMMNLEAVFTYEGTHDIHGLVIGQQLTGIPSYNPPAED